MGIDDPYEEPELLTELKKLSKKYLKKYKKKRNDCDSLSENEHYELWMTDALKDFVSEWIEEE